MSTSQRLPGLSVVGLPVRNRVLASAVISGLGVVLLAIPLWDVWDDLQNLGWQVHTTFAENVWGILLAMGLVAGGVWLADRGWEEEYVSIVTRWTVGGTLAAALVFGWVLALQMLEMGGPKPLALALDGVLVGAVATFALGVANARVAREADSYKSERNRFGGLFQNTSDAIADVELTADDRVVNQTNMAFKRTFDDPADEVVADILAGLDVEVDAATILDRVRAGERVETTATREAEGDRREFLVRLVPIDLDGGRTHLFAVLTDITERERTRRELTRRVRAQELVASLGRRAMTGERLDVLFADAVETVAEIFDNRYAEVLELDHAADELTVRAGVGWPDVVVEEATVEDRPGTVAGYALRSDTPVVVEDVAGADRFDDASVLSAPDVANTIAAAIGPVDDPWGVFATHDTDPREYTDHERSFVQAVANTLAAAIGRREYERELERREAEVRSLNQLNAVVRELTGAIIQESSRREMEELVCEHLAESDAYAGAWMGEINYANDQVVVRAAAGETEQAESAIPATASPIDRALDARELSVLRDPGEGDHPLWRPPAERDVAGGSAGHADAPATADADAPATADADTPITVGGDAGGGWSAAVIPVHYEEWVYGILTVFSTRESAFDEDESRVIGQLGELLGHAFNAFERKRALIGESAMELEFKVPGFLRKVADVEDAAGTITVDRAVPVNGESFMLYGKATPDAVGTLERFAASSPAVMELDLFDEVGETTRFQVRMGDLPIVSLVAEHGGKFQSTTFDGGDLRSVVEIPLEADVRALIERIRDDYPDAELLSQHTVSREGTSVDQVEQVLTEDLTDRQRSALEASYFAGYFEWPREVDGEEVADTMGISPSTYHQHLREGQRKLLRSIFGERDEAAIPM